VTPVELAALVAIGVAAGVLSGLLGIGGGLVMVPAMVLILGFDQHVAQGTSLLVIIPAALSGSITHYRNGRVSVRQAAYVALGGVIGASVGSVLALSVDDAVLRKLFAGFLVVVAIQIILGRGRRAAREERLASLEP
jgi:uncharacterized protein